MQRILAVLTAALLLMTTVATAQSKGGVELISRAEVEVVQKNENNEKVLKLVEASRANVVPGDTVIYTTSYSNNGDQPASDVAINNPVPEHMIYQDKSAEGRGTRIEFSLDRGKSYGPAAGLKVRTATGKERPATPADITNVRWVLEKPLQAGDKGSVSFRARVK